MNMVNFKQEEFKLSRFLTSSLIQQICVSPDHVTGLGNPTRHKITGLISTGMKQTFKHMKYMLYNACGVMKNKLGEGEREWRRGVRDGLSQEVIIEGVTCRKPGSKLWFYGGRGEGPQDCRGESV